MTERKQIQEPQRMHEALILQIRTHLALQRSNVRQNIAVGNDYALGFGRRARRKNNLQDVVATYVDRLGKRRLISYQLCDIAKIKRWHGRVGSGARPQVR